MKRLRQMRLLTAAFLIIALQAGTAPGIPGAENSKQDSPRPKRLLKIPSHPVQLRKRAPSKFPLPGPDVTLRADQWGLLNSNAEIVSPPKWDYIRALFGDEIAWASTGKHYYCIDGQGRVISESEWDRVRFQEPLSTIYKQRRIGYMDKWGNVVVEPRFNLAKPGFRDGMAVVSLNRKWGFIDSNGHVVIEPEWDNAIDFEGRFAAVKRNKKWALIDRTGKLFTKLEWDDIHPLSSLALAMRVFDYQAGKTGPQWKWRVEKNKKAGFVDERTGKILFDELEQWDDVGGAFYEGLLRVKKGGHAGFVDDQGRVVIEPTWEEVEPFSEGLAAVMKNKKWGYIDSKGTVVIEPTWERAFPFVDGMARVWQDKKWGGIDRNGKFIIPIEYQWISSLRMGHASIRQNDKWGLIDQQGKIISPIQWEAMRGDLDGVWVQSQGVWGKIDLEGKVIFKPEWDFVEWEFPVPFLDNLALVAKRTAPWKTADEDQKSEAPGFAAYITTTGKIVWRSDQK